MEKSELENVRVIDEEVIELSVNKFKNNKNKSVLLILSVMLVVSIALIGASFSLSTDSVELKKVYTSEVRTQDDPNYIDDTFMGIFNDSVIYSEIENNDGEFTIFWYKYNIDSYELEDEYSISVGNKLPVVFMDDNYIYYTSKVSTNCVNRWCNNVWYINRMDSNFENLKTFKYDGLTRLNNVTSYNYSPNFDYNLLVGTTSDNGIFVYDNSNYIDVFNSEFDGYSAVLQSDLLAYVPEISKIEAKNALYKSTTVSSSESAKFTRKYTSYLDSKDEVELYSGYLVEDSDNVAYMEAVKNDQVVWSVTSEEYVQYSQPILLDDYIVVKGTYDEEKLLGSKKSDLVVLNEKGEIVATVSNSSYYNNLVGISDEELIVERVYVEGTCSTVASASRATYSAWNVDSCQTSHYYEKYKLIYSSSIITDSISTIISNPNTSVFPIVVFVLLSVALLFVIKIGLNKTKDLK